MKNKTYRAPNAVICGDVRFGENCSVWYGAVVRADADEITIGRDTNIQENAVLHVDAGAPIRIGDGVTIGHGAIVHGASIGSNTTVGMGAIIMNGARIGRDSTVGAGTLVTQGREFPEGSLIMGSPARLIRELTEDEKEQNRVSARHYIGAAAEQLKEVNMQDNGDFYRRLRTFRRFEQEPVPDEVLTRLVDNARIRSSARNAQVVRYVIVKSHEAVAAMQPLIKWAGALPPEVGRPKTDEQPTAFIALYYEGPADSYSDIDLGIAADTICITAFNLGYGSCMLGAINKPMIKAELDIPEDATLRLLIALGRAAHRSEITDMPDDGSFKYWVDDNRNYYVPKRSLEEVAKFV